jgi:hypothetical protein
MGELSFLGYRSQDAMATRAIKILNINSPFIFGSVFLLSALYHQTLE